MKVFLSWSGIRSQRAAEALKSWLPDIIQAVDPWVSSQDVSKGSRALSHVASSLEGSNFGIICVTPENQDSQWLNFEAGALSKQLNQAFVFPFLLDIEVADLTGPLSQFQATASDSVEDVYKLLSDINQTLDTGGVPDSRLRRTFDKNWADLDAMLNEIRKDAPNGRPKQRTTQDMFRELTVLLRRQDRRIFELASQMSDTPQRQIRAPQIPIYSSPDQIRIEEALAHFGLTQKTYSLASAIDGTHAIIFRHPMSDSVLKTLKVRLRDMLDFEVSIVLPHNPTE